MMENETSPPQTTRPAPERAVLVGIQRDSSTRQETEESLAELVRLFTDAGGEVLDTRTVQLRDPCAATLLSKGHVENLALWIESSECDLVVFDDEVSPVQQRNLEKAFGCRVLTRTMVILDIFATHAKTREAMTQVELAQTRYFKTRLVGSSIASAKMGGASARIATRGPGETQLETDRRHVREHIRRLEETLKIIVQHRRTQRQRRQQTGLPIVGIVGYTNAGKSTLLNTLTHANVLAQDRLFCTLDTTVRNLTLPNGMETGLIDTVGFINKLPTTLVAAFRATLEEITYADVILHLVDASSPRLDIEFDATDAILRELGCENAPRLTVWNKIDLLDDPVAVNALPLRRVPAVAISALTGQGLDTLLEETQRLLLAAGRIAFVRIPYDHYAQVARLHRETQVLESRDTPEGKLLRCRVSPQLEHLVAPYRIETWPFEELPAPGPENETDEESENNPEETKS